MLSPTTPPNDILRANPDYQPLTSTEALEPLVDQVLAASPQSIADYKAGRTKALAYLVGQVMQLTRGKASPDVVNQLLRKKLDS